MKKIVSLFLVISMLLSLGLTAFSADKEACQPDLYLNGSKIEFPDQQTQIVDGRTLVPVRGFFEYLGCTVEWDAEEELVTLMGENGSFYIFMVIGYPGLVVFDGEDEYTGQLDVVPQIINNRTMVPMSFISQLLGYNVSWNEDAYRVDVNSPYVLTPADVTISDIFLGMMNAASNKDENKDETTDSIVTISLACDAKEIKQGDEITVYIEAEGIGDDALSAVTADFVYDKTALEYIPESAAAINADGVPQANFMYEETETEKGIEIFALVDESIKDYSKRIFQIKFKALKDGSTTVTLGNVFKPYWGYSTQIMVEDADLKNVLYEGKTLNILPTQSEIIK